MFLGLAAFVLQRFTLNLFLFFIDSLKFFSVQVDTFCDEKEQADLSRYIESLPHNST